MIRWLFFTVLLCGAVYALVVFTSPASSQPSVGDPNKQTDTPASPKRAGGPGPIDVLKGSVRDPRLMEIADGRITIVDKVDVPSEREGKLLFIGTEFKPGERIPQGDELTHKILEGKVYQHDLLFLGLEIKPDDPTPASERLPLVKTPEGGR